jgi:hypothetical protein
MAPRRQPYEHLSSQPLPQSASTEDAQQDLPPDDGGIDIVIEDDGFSPEPVQEAPQRSEPEPVRQPELQREEEIQKPNADDEAYIRLKAQLERETNRAKDFESRLGQEQATRTQAEERARQAEMEHLAAQELAIENAMQVAQQRAEQAERDAIKALEDGDYQANVKAQRALFDAQIDMRRLTDGKTEIEARRGQPRDAETPPPARQVAPAKQEQPASEADRIEAYINQSQHTPRVRDYFHRHYDDIFKKGDAEKKTNRLVAGHYAAIADGIAPDTDAYFQFIDKHMGYAQPEPAPVPAAQQQQPARSNQVQQQRQRAQMPPAAPVSRDGAQMSGGRQTIRLTQAEVSLCREMGIDPKAYAKNKVMIANGGRDPNYSGPRFTGDL